MKWEIAMQGGKQWYPLGTAEGSNRTTALESWIEKEGTVWPGRYGVRSLEETAWQPFTVDPRGAVHDRRID